MARGKSGGSGGKSKSGSGGNGKYRSAITGRYVTPGQGKRNPEES